MWEKLYFAENDVFVREYVPLRFSFSNLLHSTVYGALAMKRSLILVYYKLENYH